MCLRFPSVILLFVAAFATVGAGAPLRFCADLESMPFSNRAGQGLDNQIAVLVAHAMHRQPSFVWVRNGRGFLREQFNRNACDVLLGVPQHMRGVLPTTPYYRSAYVFVTREREHLKILSFNDPVLSGLKIGLQALQDNLSPPSLALIRAGHAAQLVGFNSFGTRGPDILRAVEDGRLGTAVVWGPLAGYFIRRDRLPLSFTPVSPLVDVSGVPFAFSISMAVHQRDLRLRSDLNAAITAVRPQIRQILARFNVPTLTPEEAR